MRITKNIRNCLCTVDSLLQTKHSPRNVDSEMYIHIVIVYCNDSVNGKMGVRKRLARCTTMAKYLLRRRRDGCTCVCVCVFLSVKNSRG